MAATCSQQFSAQSSTALFKPSGRLDVHPASLLHSPAVVRVVRGTAYIPVVNVGTLDASLNPCFFVMVFELCSNSQLGISEVPGTLGSSKVTATVNLQQNKPR